MDALLAKLVKGSECQKNFLKEIKADISGMSQKVESHATAIKQLEQQLGHMSATLSNKFRILRMMTIAQPLLLGVEKLLMIRLCL